MAPLLEAALHLLRQLVGANPSVTKNFLGLGLGAVSDGLCFPQNCRGLQLGLPSDLAGIAFGGDPQLPSLLLCALLGLRLEALGFSQRESECPGRLPASPVP